MLMPKMVALAERAWAPDPQWTKQTDRAHAAPLHAAAWSVFVSQLGLKVLPQLDVEHAVLYRIPAPGLKQVAGAVMVNQILDLACAYRRRLRADGHKPAGYRADNHTSLSVAPSIATDGWGDPHKLIQVTSHMRRWIHEIRGEWETAIADASVVCKKG
jgi:hypothetical protein